MASTTNLGNILIWHSPTPERWGAFAGGFEEVDENVEYQEREDEFDIVSTIYLLFYLFLFTQNKTKNMSFDLQEDEAELARRKMKAEEDKVDVIGIAEDMYEHNASAAGWNGDQDEDILWADEEPDDDIRDWNMKIVMEGNLET